MQNTLYSLQILCFPCETPNLFNLSSSKPSLCLLDLSPSETSKLTITSSGVKALNSINFLKDPD